MRRSVAKSGESIPREEGGGWWLRRADQAGVAGVLLLALIAMAWYWTSQGGFSGRLLEIDRAPRQKAQYTVDLNHATWPELAQLPEVGEELARRIVADREAAGPYLDHEDLRRVRGIGPKTLEKLRPYLRPMPLSESVAGK